MNKTWTVEVQEDPNTGDAIIQFPPELLETVGWKEGDTIDWQDLKNGSYQLTKIEKNTEWVLVEAVSSFRTRYMVEVPKGKTDWALDTVTMQEAKEFSQEHIGEQIISHRVVSKEEAMKLCDKDNEYGSGWYDEVKIKNFFTLWSEQKN